MDIPTDRLVIVCMSLIECSLQIKRDTDVMTPLGSGRYCEPLWHKVCVLLTCVPQLIS